MKHIIAILLSVLLMLSLASCNLDSLLSAAEDDIDQQMTDTAAEGADVNETDPVGETQTSQTEEKPLTVSDFLALYGFSEDDIMPAHFVSFEEVTLDGNKAAGTDGSTGYIKINVDKVATTADDFNAWFERLYAKMTALSVDGKLYKDYGKTEEATTLSGLQEQAWWDIMPGGNCMFTAKLAGGEALLHLAYSYDIEYGIYKLSIMYWK